MIAEAFLICAMALPPISAHRPIFAMVEERPHAWLMPEDAQVFRMITEKWHQLNQKRPPVIVTSNYGKEAQFLRQHGIHAYGMTLYPDGEDLRGTRLAFPFLDHSLAAVLNYGQVNSFELFEMCSAIGLYGVLLIKDRHLPLLYASVFRMMGFRQLPILWHNHEIWRREHDGHLKLIKGNRGHRMMEAST